MEKRRIDNRLLEMIQRHFPSLLTVGAITGRLLVETYAQTLRLYGWDLK